VPDFPAPRSVDIALSVRSHERIGGRRTDEAWLSEKWADPATRVLVLAGGRFPVTDDRTAVRWLSPSEAPPGERLLLGEADGQVHFVVLPADFRAPDDWGMLRTGTGRTGSVLDAEGGSWSAAEATCCTATRAAVSTSRAPTRR
jgi:hypothetical protein